MEKSTFIYEITDSGKYNTTCTHREDRSYVVICYFDDLYFDESNDEGSSLGE